MVFLRKNTWKLFENRQMWPTFSTMRLKWYCFSKMSSLQFGGFCTSKKTTFQKIRNYDQEAEFLKNKMLSSF